MPTHILRIKVRRRVQFPQPLDRVIPHRTRVARERHELDVHAVLPAEVVADGDWGLEVFGEGKGLAEGKVREEVVVDTWGRWVSVTSQGRRRGKGGGSGEEVGREKERERAPGKQLSVRSVRVVGINGTKDKRTHCL